MENEWAAQLSRENLKESLDKTGQILEVEEELPEASSEGSKPIKKNMLYQLWKWLGLYDQTFIDILKLGASIAIPLLLYQLSVRQSDISLDNQRHEIMANYLDKMTSLMEKGLDNDPTRKAIAKAITLNATRQLDGERRGQILKFLYGANLIGGGCDFDDKTLSIVKGSCKPGLIELSDAKLNETSFERPIPLTGADLKYATLTKADLPGIELLNADLQSAKLTNANLTGAILNNAKLQKAKLEGANLTGAYLQEADLSYAYLVGADLRGVDLSATILAGAILKGAKYNDRKLEIAYPDGKITIEPTRFPQGFSPEQQGMELSNSAFMSTATPMAENEL